MYLQKDTATKIIEEISMILDYDINIMDEKGAILASTDLSRIGMFHEGAYRIIHYKMKELPVYEDGQYQGCRKGINLPIYLKEKIIGVIGITGEISEVMKYGKVLKKMTEIIALDLFSYHKKSQQEQARLFFVNEWVNKEASEFSSSFKAELQTYGLSAKSAFTVALVAPSAVLDDADTLSDHNCVFIQNGETGLVIYGTDNSDQIARFIKKAAQNSNQATFLCAIGSPQKDYTKVKHSYQQAKKLMNIKVGQTGIFSYEGCIAQLIYNDVDLEYKEILSQQILSGFSEQEKSDFAAFMDVYIENNGSVNGIAEKLYVHKNTVQYKINKIIRRTGKDPRVISDAVILMMVAGWLRQR